MKIINKIANWIMKSKIMDMVCQDPAPIAGTTIVFYTAYNTEGGIITTNGIIVTSSDLVRRGIEIVKTKVKDLPNLHHVDIFIKGARCTIRKEDI